VSCVYVCVCVCVSMFVWDSYEWFIVVLCTCMSMFVWNLYTTFSRPVLVEWFIVVHMCFLRVHVFMPACLREMNTSYLCLHVCKYTLSVCVAWAEKHKISSTKCNCVHKWSLFLVLLC
jgi:hypothetical protein